MWIIKVVRAITLYTLQRIQHNDHLSYGMIYLEALMHQFIVNSEEIFS